MALSAIALAIKPEEVALKGVVLALNTEDVPLKGVVLALNPEAVALKAVAFALTPERVALEGIVLVVNPEDVALKGVVLVLNPKDVALRVEDFFDALADDVFNRVGHRSGRPLPHPQKPAKKGPPKSKKRIDPTVQMPISGLLPLRGDDAPGGAEALGKEVKKKNE